MTARLAGLRVVWTVHNVIPHAPVFGDDARARRRLLAASDLVIVHAEPALAELRRRVGEPPRQVRVIPLGPFARARAADPAARDAPRRVLRPRRAVQGRRGADRGVRAAAAGLPAPPDRRRPLHGCRAARPDRAPRAPARPARHASGSSISTSPSWTRCSRTSTRWCCRSGTSRRPARRRTRRRSASRSSCPTCRRSAICKAGVVRYDGSVTGLMALLHAVARARRRRPRPARRGRLSRRARAHLVGRRVRDAGRPTARRWRTPGEHATPGAGRRARGERDAPPVRARHRRRAVPHVGTAGREPGACCPASGSCSGRSPPACSRRATSAVLSGWVAACTLLATVGGLGLGNTLIRQLPAHPRAASPDRHQRCAAGDARCGPQHRRDARRAAGGAVTARPRRQRRRALDRAGAGGADRAQRASSTRRWSRRRPRAGCWRRTWWAGSSGSRLLVPLMHAGVVGLLLAYTGGAVVASATRVARAARGLSGGRGWHRPAPSLARPHLRFSLANYLGGVVGILPATAVPLIVLGVLGPTPAALLRGRLPDRRVPELPAVGDRPGLLRARVAARRGRGARAAQGARHQLRRDAPGLRRIRRAAPLLLRIFGPGYAAAGTDAAAHPHARGARDRAHLPHRLGPQRPAPAARVRRDERDQRRARGRRRGARRARRPDGGGARLARGDRPRRR